MGSISEFIERNFRHFNAAVLKDAADAYIAHLDRGGKMMITLAGAMSTAELGVSLAEMIRRDKVHAITCTGANMEEDLFNLVARSKYENADKMILKQVDVLPLGIAPPRYAPATRAELGMKRDAFYCVTVGRGLAHTEQMLEILASVRPGRARPFADFESLVLRHAGRVSGCIAVLLAWDEPRREFVRKLCALGVPLLVLVLVEAGEETALDPGPLRGQPHQFRVLEVGRIEEGLLRVV